MSKLIISFKNDDVMTPQPWPVGVSAKNIVTSGLGPDDGATLVGFGPLGEQHIDIFVEEAREHPERAIGLAPTFGGRGNLFEWGFEVSNIKVVHE